MKYELLMAARKLNAYAAVDSGVDMCSACYNCKYRKNIPGSVHSKCTNHLALVLTDEKGIKSGEFLHPENFDPKYLKFCDGFEKMTERKMEVVR